MARSIVLFPGSLGDFVCFLPTLQKIGTCQGDVVFVGREMACGLLRGHMCFPPTVSLEISSLEEARFARLFTLSSSPDAALEEFFLHATAIVSWSGSALPQFRKNLEEYLPGCVKVFPFFSGQAECHASAYYLYCLAGKGEGREPPSLTIRPKPHWLHWGKEYWRRRKWEQKHVLVLHPGSGGWRKRWDQEGFTRVAKWWTSREEREVLIVLGPVESEEKDFWSRFGTVETALELAQVSSLLHFARCYVGNDSGVSHLAGAIGARGVVIFGPTRPEQWRPIGGQLEVVHNTRFRSQWPDREGISLEEVSPSHVIEGLTNCL